MKKATALTLLLALLLSLGVPAFAFTAKLSTQALSVDGKAVDCEKYNIDGSNYFKLRDLAKLLDGTGSQFDVGYDSAKKLISITTNHAYTSPNGTELVVGEDQSAKTKVSPQTIMIDGVERSELTAYNIGGNNFFQLRQMGDALGFDVDYDSATRTMLVTSREAEEISVSLDVISFALKIGETRQLAATVKPAGTTVTWSSGNPAIATVDQNGLVTAVGEGKVDIFVAAGDIKTFCTLTVKKRNDSFAFIANEAKESGQLQRDGTYKKSVGHDSDNSRIGYSSTSYYYVYNEKADCIHVFSEKYYASNMSNSNYLEIVELIIPYDVPDSLTVNYTKYLNVKSELDLDLMEYVYIKDTVGESYRGTIHPSTYNRLRSGTVTYESPDPDSTTALGICALLGNALLEIDNELMFSGTNGKYGVRGLGFKFSDLRILTKDMAFSLEGGAYKTSDESYSIMNQDYSLYISYGSWSPKTQNLKIGFISVDGGLSFYTTASVSEASNKFYMPTVGLPAGEYYVYVGNPGSATITGVILYGLRYDG